MTAFALLFTLAAIGIAETVYLIRTRQAAEQPVCIIGHNCGVVLTSKYNHLFGIHNDLAGLGFYLVSTVLTAALVLEVREIDLVRNTFTLLLVAGSLMSVILMFLQWRVIKAWCFWCVMSACTNWLMLLILGLHLVSL